MATVTRTETDLFRIVEDACTFAPDKSKATIVVESKELENFAKAIDDLDGLAVKALATGYAASEGVADPRLNGLVRCGYAVNEDGVDLLKVCGANNEPLPADHPKKQPAAYRVDVPLTRKLV